MICIYKYKILEKEFKFNQNNDFIRIFQIIRNISLKNHPFNNFGAGNKKVLKPNISLLTPFKKFHDKYYKGNYFSCVICSRFSIEELEKSVKLNLGKMEKSEEKSILKLEFPFETNFNKIITLKKKENFFEIWFIVKNSIEINSLKLFVDLFNCNYNYSFQSFIKEKKNVKNCKAYIENSNYLFKILKIKCNFDEKFDKNEFIEAFFEFIEFLKNNKLEKNHFEQKKIIDFQKLNFFGTKYNSETLNFLSLNLEKFKEKDKIILYELFENGNDFENNFYKFIQELNSSTFFIIRNNSNNIIFNQKDNFFGSEYNIEDFLPLKKCK